MEFLSNNNELHLLAGIKKWKQERDSGRARSTLPTNVIYYTVWKGYSVLFVLFGDYYCAAMAV